jgi:hypothetical protein
VPSQPCPIETPLPGSSGSPGSPLPIPVVQSLGPIPRAPQSWPWTVSLSRATNNKR